MRTEPISSMNEDLSKSISCEDFYSVFRKLPGKGSALLSSLKMSDNKKSVFSVNISDAKSKRNMLKAASSLLGIDSLSVNLEKRQLTVVGTVDPVKVAHKLRKKFNPRIETVGLDKKDGGTKTNQTESMGKGIIQVNQPSHWPGPWAWHHWHHPAEECHSSCVIS
ncbi:hypothetical protein MLD38_013933 [Melastoma candidum]|uniref:Uncharacterized protein n=1 Tax=Melastoma candidum TaxID=119954 RepID=A0ACB9RCH6_9MYRT|nr:hypothetical protein MLD38_013933 [Melastoma candidum]